MDHFKFHSGAKFEGFYTRFHFPSGGSLVVIICSVHKATNRPVDVNATYVPPDQGPIWQMDFWPTELGIDDLEDRDGFVLSAALDGDESGRETIPTSASVAKDEAMAMFTDTGGRFSLHTRDGLHFDATIHSHTPWSKTASSPAGIFVNLPLPLHWHVLSSYSPCSLRLRLPESYTSKLSPKQAADLQSDLQGVAHLEKNWATGFPTAHVWVQGYRIPPKAPSIASRLPPQPSGATQPHLITLAGGAILGMEAFLVGYRNSTANISIDFRPPWTLSLVPLLRSVRGWWSGSAGESTLGSSWLAGWAARLLSPFAQVTRDWPRRTQHFSFCNPLAGWKLDIEATGRAGGRTDSEAFFNLAAPYPAGFKPKWMAQCLRGRVFTKLYRRRWGLGGRLRLWWWELACEDWFENAGVEFGGEYYPGRGVGVGPDGVD